jgi:phenylacetate-CoA ligase
VPPSFTLAGLVRLLEKTQWKYVPFPPPQGPVLTRHDLQTMHMEGPVVSHTSGSTGEPVTVHKGEATALWWHATNIREMQWRKWKLAPDTRIAAITRHATQFTDYQLWSPDEELYPGGVLAASHPYQGDVQGWLEKRDPHYLVTVPSVVATLDRTRLKSLRGIRTTGEQGGTNYSCEESGTIALQCPDNPSVYHVMENIILEIVDGEVLITETTSPYIKRYKLGDTAEWATCHCGRTLPAIKCIVGRIRNLMHRPDGTQVFAAFGTYAFPTMGLPFRRYQMLQTAVDRFEFHVVSTQMSPAEESRLIAHMQAHIRFPCTISIVYRGEFPPGKFEEFRWVGG